MNRIKLISNICLISLISLFLIGCSQEIPEVLITEIQIIPNTSIRPANTSKLIASDPGFDILTEILEGYSTFPAVSHDNHGDLLLTYIKDDGMEGSYHLDLDLVSQNIYISSLTESRIIDESLSRSFLTNTTFEYLLDIPFDIPEFSISLDNESMLYNCTSVLTYPAYNGTTINQENTLCGNSDISLSDNPYSILAIDTIDFQFDIAPDTIVQTMRNTTTDVSYSYPIETELVIPNEEGTYEISLKCTWNEENTSQYFGYVEYVFYIDNDLDPEVFVSPSDITPGEIVVVRATNLNHNQSMLISSDFGVSESTYTYENNAYGIIAVPCTSSTGNYTVSVELTEDDRIIDTQTLTFNVVDRDFEVDMLYVTESTAAINNNDNAAQDQVHFDRARANPIPYPLFDSAFIQPTEYERISTEYGVIRVTNDNWDNTRRHFGIDFANTLGTPVYASNSGVVTLSYELHITGNTIIIDHGMGLFSMYYHLDELLVDEGEMVEKGAHIANMGTTGYSTGSHLHFGIWHDGVYLNPWSFFEDGYLDIE